MIIRHTVADIPNLDRYKYLQKPLEESALPGLLQYIHRWSAAQKDKLSIATGLLISQGLANASCLQALTKDHLVKNGQYLSTPFQFISAYHNFPQMYPLA
jgi:hypothetical protein